MKHVISVLAAAVGVGASTLAWTGAAYAQDSDASGVTEAEAKPEDPTRALIGGGIFVFTMSYLPAVAIGASSNLDVDQKLFVPVAGPWMDLAHRPACGAADCSSEMAYRSLIVTDGLLQGMGALMTIVGMLGSDDSTPSTATPMHDAAVHVSPAIGAGTYGLTAFGSF